jgi:hypothetical protein
VETDEQQRSDQRKVDADGGVSASEKPSPHDDECEQENVGPGLMTLCRCPERPERVAEVRKLPFMYRAKCFGVTKDGQPLHPLRLGDGLPLVSLP